MASTAKKGDFSYILIYLLEWLTGLIFFMISGNDSRKKLHSIQAIMIGVIAFVLTFLLPILGLLIWLFAMYVGYKASVGVDVVIPFVTDFAKKYA